MTLLLNFHIDKPHGTGKGSKMGIRYFLPIQLDFLLGCHNFLRRRGESFFDPDTT
jgi:hypothetical protein